MEKFYSLTRNKSFPHEGVKKLMKNEQRTVEQRKNTISRETSNGSV